jgi:hypothetical protein
MTPSKLFVAAVWLTAVCAGCSSKAPISTDHASGGADGGGSGGGSGSGAGGSGPDGSGDVGVTTGGQGGALPDAGSRGDPDAGVADTCAGPADCPGGVCWQRLDGVKECAGPVTIPRINIATCGPGHPECCQSDADCAKSAGGRCVSYRETDLNCGGAQPFGNACVYEACHTDSDCRAQMPPGATVSTCVPPGALGFFVSMCIHGGCRTDTDCALHPGGRCLFGLAATHNGMCDLRQVLYCAYPSDPCQPGPDACSGSSSILRCLPNEDYQGRHCAPGPPQYP